MGHDRIELSSGLYKSPVLTIERMTRVTFCHKTRVLTVERQAQCDYIKIEVRKLKLNAILLAPWSEIPPKGG